MLIYLKNARNESVKPTNILISTFNKRNIDAARDLHQLMLSLQRKITIQLELRTNTLLVTYFKKTKITRSSVVFIGFPGFCIVTCVFI